MWLEVLFDLPSIAVVLLFHLSIAVEKQKPDIQSLLPGVVDEEQYFRVKHTRSNVVDIQDDTSTYGSLDKMHINRSTSTNYLNEDFEGKRLSIVSDNSNTRHSNISQPNSPHLSADD
jgi:hypothetical protein